MMPINRWPVFSSYHPLLELRSGRSASNSNRLDDFISHCRLIFLLHECASPVLSRSSWWAKRGRESRFDSIRLGLCVAGRTAVHSFFFRIGLIPFASKINNIIEFVILILPSPCASTLSPCVGPTSGHSSLPAKATGKQNRCHM